MALLADDDVVVDQDSERLGRGHDLAGHLDVGARRRGVARRVSAAARTSFSSVIAASPMPGTSRNSSSGAFTASAKVPKRATRALARGLVSRRGAARNRISSSSS